jgi:hypothetical protein
MNWITNTEKTGFMCPQKVEFMKAEINVCTWHQWLCWNNKVLQIYSEACFVKHEKIEKSFRKYRTSNVLDAIEDFVLFHVILNSNSDNKSDRSNEVFIGHWVQ